jgi:hypothetical protein
MKELRPKEPNGGERLLATLDLMEFGIAVMRQTIVRRFPDASNEEIVAELNRWLLDQPHCFLPFGSQAELRS